MKRTVRVTVVKELEIEFLPSVFVGMSEEDYLKEVKSYFGKDAKIDEVFGWVAEMVVRAGYPRSMDVALVGKVAPYGQCDARWRVIYDDIESEVYLP